jgi:hypothetical protein
MVAVVVEVLVFDGAVVGVGGTAVVGVRGAAVVTIVGVVASKVPRSLSVPQLAINTAVSSRIR